MPARNRFSAMRSWAIATAAAGGARTTSRRQPVEGRGGRVLELGRDDGARRGQAVEGAGIVVRRDEVLVGDATGGRGGVGIEHDGAVAHQPRRDDA